MKKIFLLLLFLCLASNVYADDPQGLVAYPEGKIMGFRGLDTRSTAPTVPDGRATSLLNVKLSAAFDLKKRPGYSIINDTLDDLDISSPAITGLFDTEYSNSNKWLLAFVGTKLKYDNSGTWTTVGGSPSITTGKNYQWQCIMALDNAVCTNDTDVLIKVDSTPTASVLDVSDLTDTLTKAKTLAWYRNYLIFGNTVENSVERPTRFRWSSVGTIETYDDDNYNDISTYAGDEIVGFAELYGELYIFLNKSIWRASFVGGDDIFVFRKVIEGFGAVARDSIKVVTYPDGKSEIIFLNEEKHIFTFNGIRIAHIDLRIHPDVYDFNESRLQYAQAVFDGEYYYLSVSTGSLTTNDTVYVYNLETGEWTKYDQIDANAFARVDASSEIKTYFGNYNAFVYWLDNPDLNNDVDGATGIIESAGQVDVLTETGAQILVDSDLATGDYTGAIIKITSGTAAGEEAVILSGITTGVIIANTFTTTPDSTSVYSIGAIDAQYTGKHYDLGDSSREKAFLGMLLWASEASSSAVDVDHYVDFGSILGSETIDLSPSTASLWDSAIWDESVWGTTGNKIYTVPFTGFGNTIQIKFENDSIDEGFHLYGYSLLGTMQDVKQ